MPTLNHSILREHPFEPLQVEGKIPAHLRGTLYRTGPGLLERFGKSVSHPFDSDGAVTAIRLGDNTEGATQIVKTKEYQEEEKQGRFLYGTNTSSLRQIRNNLTGRVKSTGNTNVLHWQDRVYALVENSKPVEIDPQTLETRGVTDFGIIPRAFSAHPHRVATLKTTFNFGMRGKSLDLFALPDSGQPRHLGAIEMPWIGMVHDFIATDKHLVFFLGPAKLVLWRALSGIGGLSRYFRWDQDAGMHIVIVPLATPDKPIRFQVDSFWVWHFVNAYESQGEIVVDAIRHDTFGAFAAPSSAGPENSEPVLFRFRINPQQTTMTSEALWAMPCEFPSVHPALGGVRHRHIWLQTFKDRHGIGAGVARFDTETGQVQRWVAPVGHLDCEPLFVPSGISSETEGAVLQLIQDPTVGKSYLAILNAQRLDADPVAKIWFKQAIPMTFHGVFVPEKIHTS